VAVLRVGDRVTFEEKTWRVESLGRRTNHRAGAKITDGDLYATLVLEAESPGQPPHKVVVPEGAWDEVRLLEE
jgi:hypothetical protein